MNDKDILNYLRDREAVLTDGHFVYTSRLHGRIYLNMRTVGHDVHWLDLVGRALAGRLGAYKPDIVLGAETLGRTLATLTAVWMNAKPSAIWCDMSDAGNSEKQASFSPKLNFGRLIPGRRVAIVDDLLTSGSSIRGASRLIRELGGEVVAGGVVVRRTPDVDAATCDVPVLEVLADVSGFEVLTPEECRAHGPCSQRVPVVLRPGHGHAWSRDNPDYPTVDLAA